MSAQPHESATTAIAELHAKALEYCKKLREGATNADAQKIYPEFLQYVANWREKYNSQHPHYPLPPKKIKCQLGLFGQAHNVQLTPNFVHTAIDKLANEINTDFNNRHNGRNKITGVGQSL